MSVWLSHHFRALVLALKRLLMSPLGSLLSISVIGIAFSLPAGIYVMLENLRTVAGQFSAAPQLSLFLKLDSSAEAVAEVRSRLEHQPHITTFQFISRESALREFGRSTGLADIAESFEKNPLPDAFVITASGLSADQLDELHVELQKWSEIEHAQLDSAWARRLALTPSISERSRASRCWSICAFSFNGSSTCFCRSSSCRRSAFRSARAATSVISNSDSSAA